MKTKANKKQEIEIHSKTDGTLYIHPSEIFKSDEGKALLDKLMNSSLYRQIKEKEKEKSNK